MNFDRESFINAKAQDSAVALMSGNSSPVTYGQLRQLSSDLKNLYQAGFMMLRIENTLEALAFYIAAVEAKIPLMLLDQEIPEDYLFNLIEIYKPSFIVNTSNDYRGFSSLGLKVSALEIQKNNFELSEVNQNLGLLLATSGSTGSPKFVRLSHKAIRENARSISSALKINESERAITTLPSSYTYGLSVINSHIVAGASIVVTQVPMISNDFWELVSSFKVTSFAGVPTSYLLLKQMKWSPELYPSLRYVTQAGGRLQDDDRLYFLNLFGKSSVDFIIMYGQTEATARISICPTNILKENISAAGLVIPNGEIHINNQDSNGVGEVIYRGPNVMMGYAESATDLKLGDVLQGELVTGDLGYLSNSILFLTGRTKRIVKIFGVRVSLDDVDAWLSKYGRAVSVQGNDSVVIFLENESVDITEAKASLAQHLGVNSRGIKFQLIREIPLMSSGKIDFQTLQKLVSS